MTVTSAPLAGQPVRTVSPHLRGLASPSVEKLERAGRTAAPEHP
jgi:hypothetical protein